ncbi:STAS domain-containing protein [Actinoplanes sp. NPDC048796]|uniref:STAS domain-containing protein n=1 Tax=unclassified Actinoplanes TaxID=2626549 RepID=UPI0033C5895C
MALTAEEAVRFAGLLEDNSDALVTAWTDRVATTLRGRLSHAELGRQHSELRKAFQTALSGGAQTIGDESAAELRAQLSDLSASRARQGFSVTETAVSVFAFKEAVLGVVDQSGGGETALRDYLALSAFVDEAALFTSDSYVRVREELIADQAEQLLELSTPVVKLWEGVVAVPLVGTLDSARAQVVMERLLQTLVDTGSPYAIIDITGVPAVDTQVAQHVLKTVVAARLMGADCIISGIRPQIAQTIVALGIEFGDIATKASLADALRYVLGKTGQAKRLGR